MKKQVIAYLHTHWDREWYREFEVFRLRLLKVFDNVLELLENGNIPSFYFDGQVSALLDYLELRPEKESLVRKLIGEKKLFIGPFYCLVDEFLTDRTVFEKNLEIGLKISKDFGCTDFIGYFADTFGHSKNIPPILQKYNIDKIMVWRGVPDLPTEFIFNGVNTINLVRGYFMDIFSAPITIEKKAAWLKENLDLIAEKSGDVLLLPIGADHLGVEKDIAEQIKSVNAILEDYEIKLSNPFEYFDLAFSRRSELISESPPVWDEELRDNSKTFILPGCYSARTKLKQYNVKCTYELEQANRLQKHFGGNYASAIEYAYKLLIQNQAHDGICGCGTDLTHEENISRYKKILQITKTIVEELRLEHNFETPIVESTEILEGYEVLSTKGGFDNKILYNTQKIPITEDFTEIYTLKMKPAKIIDIRFEINKNKLDCFVPAELAMTDAAKRVEIEFVRFKDEGDTYNYGAIESDEGEKAEIISFENNILKTNFFDVKVDLSENLINFDIIWDNKLKNTLWQVKFNLPKPVHQTFSEDMNTIIERKFDPFYNMREHLPKTRGIEVRTNFAPLQRYVGTQGFGVITKGLTEYEVKENSLLITLLRSTGVISNPKNPTRSTPAGPPLETPGAQQLGENRAEFSFGFFQATDYRKHIDEVYPGICID